MTPLMATIHVVTYGELWAVKREGTDEPLSTHNTQADATNAGRAQAKLDEVELVVHGQDGQIRENDSYGNDPRDVPG
jgi:hypothetical protein